MARGPLSATWYILVFGQAVGGMPSFPQGALSEPKCDLSPFWLKGLIISQVFSPPALTMWVLSLWPSRLDTSGHGAALEHVCGGGYEVVLGLRTLTSKV